MIPDRKSSLFTKEDRTYSRKRSEVFLLASILFHVILLILFSLWTINTASKADKPVSLTLKEEPNSKYEFNDFPQDHETDKDVKSNRLSDKNRKVERETVRPGTPLGGGASHPGRISPPPEMPSRPNDTTPKREKTDTLLAKKEITPELDKRKGETEEPRPNKKGRLSVEDLIPGSDDVARLDQPYGSTAPGIKEGDNVSLDTTEFKYYAYFAHIKRQIELAWNYPLEAQKNGWGGRLTLIFTVEKNGNVSNVKLLKSSGYEILDEYAVKAITVASPFNPIPDSIGSNRLRISASFQYINSLYGVRW